MATTDEILNEMVKLGMLQHDTQVKLADVMTQQNTLIANIPSRYELRAVNTIMTAILTLVLTVATFFLHSSIADTAHIGQLNQQTVATYCAVDGSMPECVLKGSDTAKATAILTNCRVFAVLTAATPPSQRTELSTNAPCKALGF